MTDRMEQLHDWMDAPESEHLEFKEAKNTFNFDKLVNYCVALANERGGKLILGVTDQRPRRVVGSQAFPSPSQTTAGLLARLHVRVDAEEIMHPDGRVLVFHVPSRPIGVPVHINGIYWMRSGEELVAMTPDQIKRIMDEAEPDFSSTLCSRATLTDLDTAAVELFRERWIRKSGNEGLRTLSSTQLLTDAELLVDGQVTYAALTLLGTRSALGRHLAQAEVVFEYRSNDVSGPAAQREEFRQGFLPTLDAIWNLINLRNDKQHFQDGLYIWDIPNLGHSDLQ